MHRFLHCLSAAVCLLLAGALEAKPVQVPPPPADGIRDDARSMSPEARKALAAEMKAFEQRSGTVIFIDTNTFLEQDVSTTERSRALVDGWIGHQPGVVFCLNRGVRPVPFIFFSQELSERYSDPELTQATGETLEAMARMSAPENRLPVGVKVMMNRLRALDAANASRNRLFHRRELEMMAAFGALLFVCVVIAFLFIRLSHKEEAVEAVKHHFPDVEVGQRFGAPGGGGVIVEVSCQRQ